MDEAAAEEVLGGFSRVGKGEASVRKYREGLERALLGDRLSRHIVQNTSLSFLYYVHFHKNGSN